MEDCRTQDLPRPAEVPAEPITPSHAYRFPRIRTLPSRRREGNHSLVRSGQLRLIGVTTANRLPQFPDLRTVAESGLPGFFFNSWFAILAPAGTPKDIIARLNTEVLQALADPEVRGKLENLGFSVRGSSAEELRAVTREQLAKYARVVKEMGIANE
jgi:tripartite-type tricarboxylate transporter receptor subunit TctC